MADATGYVALAGTLITAVAQIFSTRISSGAKTSVEEVKKALADAVEAAKKEAAAASAASAAAASAATAAANELRTYVSAQVGPVLTELQLLRGEVARMKRTATQPSLPSEDALAKMVGADDLARRLDAVEHELATGRAAEAARQREMGEVMALLRMLTQRDGGRSR